MRGVSHMMIGATLSINVASFYPEQAFLIVGVGMLSALLPDLDNENSTTIRLLIPFEERKFIKPLFLLLSLISFAGSYCLKLNALMIVALIFMILAVKHRGLFHTLWMSLFLATAPFFKQ